jgi:cell division septation protein DedD
MWNKILLIVTVFATVLVTVLVTASTAGAQTRDSSLYLRAQEMVANGDAASGRALVDSLLNATSPDSVQYAEALYWRAALATSATSAEQDYRRIVVDYPTSSWVDKALLRMGQLELTRSDYDEALQHLQRIPAEHPNSQLRAKASYWIARVLFEKNDVTNACVANADALSSVSQSDVELKNQIDFQRQRCHNIVTSAPLDSTQVAAVPTKSATDTKEQKSVEKSEKINSKATSSKALRPASKSVESKLQTTSDVPTTTTAGYTVQVAAYYDRSQAYDLAAKLHTRGYQTAHVEGEKAPYRVRIGPFPSRSAAAKMLAKLQEKKISGFVVKE